MAYRLKFYKEESVDTSNPIMSTPWLIGRGSEYKAYIITNNESSYKLIINNGKFNNLVDITMDDLKELKIKCKELLISYGVVFDKEMRFK